MLYLFNQRGLKDSCLKENDEDLRESLDIVQHLVSLDSFEALKPLLITVKTLGVENLDSEDETKSLDKAPDVKMQSLKDGTTLMLGLEEDE